MSTETVVVMATKPNDAKTIEARDTKIISQNYENLRIQSMIIFVGPGLTVKSDWQ